jgi:hypothetical protein
MEPTPRKQWIGGEEKDAIGPAGELIVGIVDTVGIEEAVAFGNLITFAASAEKIEGVPQAELEKKKLEQPCGERALTKAVGIGKDDRSAGDAKHFGEDKGRIRDVVENAHFADGIETGIGERQGVAGSLEEGNRGSNAVGEALLQESGNGFDTTDKSAGKSGSNVTQTTAGGGADVEQTTDLEGAKEGNEQIAALRINRTFVGVHKVVGGGGLSVVAALNLCGEVNGRV